MKDIRENIFEGLGIPILKAMTEPLRKIQKYFHDNAAEVEKWAIKVGTKVGEYVTDAAKMMQDAFNYLNDHADDIRAAISDAASVIRGVVEFIIAHKETLAIAFGAKMALPAAVGVAQALPAVGSALGAKTLGGSVAAGGITAVAAVAWFEAVDQLVQVIKLGTNASHDEMARKEALVRRASALHGVEVKDYEQLREAFVQNADAIGMTTREAGKYADALWEQNKPRREAVRRLGELEKMQELPAQVVRAPMAIPEKEAIPSPYAPGMEPVAGQGELDEWLGYYNRAIQMHDDALAKEAASAIAGSNLLQTALMSANSNVEGGFDNLAEMVKGKSEEFAKVLHGMAAERAEKAKSQAVNLNFHGATFHIKQDFKDKDPERLALLLRRDIVKQIVNPTQSRFGTPFGL
jgi:hypothetical protein